MVSGLGSSPKEGQSDWLRREGECFRAVRSLEDILQRSGQRGQVWIGCGESVWSFLDLEEAEERKQRKKGGLVGRGVNKRTRREEGVRQSQRVKTEESLRKQMEGEGQWAKV